MNVPKHRFVDLKSPGKVYTGNVAHVLGCIMLGGEPDPIGEDQRIEKDGQVWPEEKAPDFWASFAQSKMFGQSIPAGQC